MSTKKTRSLNMYVCEICKNKVPYIKTKSRNVTSVFLLIMNKHTHICTYSYAFRSLKYVRKIHNYFCLIFLVPTPTVTVTVPNTQTVGQSLTLQCEVTTVRGITSRVDIVWNSGGTELVRINVSSATMGNSLVYTDNYTISQLSTTDDDRVVKCEGVINASPSVMANDSITLDVTGEYTYVHIMCFDCT